MYTSAGGEDRRVDGKGLCKAHTIRLNYLKYPIRHEDSAMGTCLGINKVHK